MSNATTGVMTGSGAVRIRPEPHFGQPLMTEARDGISVGAVLNLVVAVADLSVT